MTRATRTGGIAIPGTLVALEPLGGYARGMLLLLAGCVPEPANEESAAIRLRWYANGPEDSWEQAQAGLWWSLANLGGLAPADGSAISAVDGDDQQVDFTFHLNEAGFTDVAARALDRVVTTLLASDEARDVGAVDVGRFLMKTLHAPWVYYAATEACPTLSGWRSARLGESPSTYEVTVSQLVQGDRRVVFNPPDGTVPSMGFEAVESEGFFEDATFDAEITEYETVDVMPSGQQRFAVYDADGDLAPFAAASPAGPPGKCMWCHEGTFQRGASENPGYDAFIEALEAMDEDLRTYRAALDTSVDFETAEVHMWGEYLTGGFLGPTPRRLALEWGVSPSDVTAELASLPTHIDPERPDLGPVYARSDIDAWLASDTFAPLTVPDSTLEVEDTDLIEGDGSGLVPCGP